MIGILYVIVIVLANTIGAISGMGGGVLIKPIFDLINVHSVSEISFYATLAVFTMSIVSTTRQIQSGQKANWRIVFWVATGAIMGGILGNITLEYSLNRFESEDKVQLMQIILTVITLLFAFCFTKYDWPTAKLMRCKWYLVCGLCLGFLASLLGIGGGPINVSLFMLMFSFKIKEATFYSICTIFFSQLAKLLTILFTTGVMQYDLSMLYYIIPAAMIGGIIGAKLTHLLSEDKVTLVFQSVVICVLVINCYNAYDLF
ncbi:sulfite exporter TauE/SafE family protein [Pseudolactococcus plantarum]|nr:sulfite exporter TauE/SafE family protein [Lactococcus plantarum]HCN75482.1 sulfite exporter TauE/SafE family protein [Lactococcus sp.]